MYVTPILLLLLASNVFADGKEDWKQALFSNMGINTKETSCVVQNFKVNLDTLMSLANKQQNEANPEAIGDGNMPELTPLSDDCQKYYASSSMATFWGANSSCWNAGIQFITPDTPAKFQCLRKALKWAASRFNYWIGATNTNRPFFYWVTTNQFAHIDVDYWAEGPTGLHDRCIYISAVDGLIREDICSNSRRYICEL